MSDSNDVAIHAAKHSLAKCSAEQMLSHLVRSDELAGTPCPATPLRAWLVEDFHLLRPQMPMYGVRARTQSSSAYMGRGF